MLRVDVLGGRDAAQVHAVAHGQQREHGDTGVFHGMQAPTKVPPFSHHPVAHRGRQIPPHAHGLERLWRQVERFFAQHLVAELLFPREPDHVRGDPHPSIVRDARGHLAVAHRADDVHVAHFSRLCVIVGVDGLEQRNAPPQIQPGDQVARPLVEIDRPGMGAKGGGRGIDLFEDGFIPARVAQQHTLPARRAQPDPLGRIVAAPIQPAIVAVLQLARVFQVNHCIDIAAAKQILVLWRERHLVCGARQVLGQHVAVAGVTARGLVRSLKEVAWMSHIVLVERIVEPDQHRQSLTVASSGASGLLPHAGNGPRISDQYGGVQVPDVDAQLERRGGGETQQLPGEQGLFQGTALLRHIARPVGSDAAHQIGGRLLQRFLGIAEDQFSHAPRARKGEVAHAVLGHGGEQAGCLGVGAAPHAVRRVQQRRVPEDKGALSLRRAVLVDHPWRDAGERLDVLRRVGDRRRTGDKLGLVAIHPTDPPQAAEHASHLRPKNPTVDVRLVDHHVAQVPEKRRPQVVVWQDTQVQHVRVSEQDRCTAANGTAFRAGRVAVIYANANA